MNSKELIEEGNNLINKIIKRDVFKIGSLEDSLNEEDFQRLKNWIAKLESISYSFKEKQLGNELRNLWFYNGDRISSNAIKRAIEILEMDEKF